jgi:hypothetical protein
VLATDEPEVRTTVQVRDEGSGARLRRRLSDGEDVTVRGVLRVGDDLFTYFEPDLP